MNLAIIAWIPAKIAPVMTTFGMARPYLRYKNLRDATLASYRKVVNSILFQQPARKELSISKGGLAFLTDLYQPKLKMKAGL
jgi:hypothetical protein